MEHITTIQCAYTSARKKRLLMTLLGQCSHPHDMRPPHPRNIYPSCTLTRPTNPDTQTTPLTLRTVHKHAYPPVSILLLQEPHPQHPPPKCWPPHLPRLLHPLRPPRACRRHPPRPPPPRLHCLRQPPHHTL